MESSSRIASVSGFEDLLEYLETELDWPIRSMSIEELTFTFDAANDLGLPERVSTSINKIYQFRSLTLEQPFGIFFVEFDSRYLPVGVMRRLLSALATRRRATLNPVDRQTWSVEDLLFISASGAGRQRRMDFAHFSSDGDRSPPVLRVLGWGTGEPAPKLEWVDSQLRASLRWPSNGDAAIWKQTWTAAFTAREVRHRTAWSDLDTASREAIAALYAAADLTVDALPYTDDFEWMRDAFNEHTGLSLGSHDFWRALSSARKSGQLTRKQR